MFLNQGLCNSSLGHKFYANRNTHHIEINKSFIRDSWVRFSLEALNYFLGTPNCDNANFFNWSNDPLLLGIVCVGEVG